MLNRIVKMTFRADCASDFVAIFNQNKQRIAGFDGCAGVELLQDISNPNIFFTYSKWETENNLEQYRNSALFNEIWSAVKKMFTDKPEAWSVKSVTE